MANIHTPIPNLKLNDGNSIPMLGYGTGTAWYKSGDESKTDQACIDATKMSIKMGYYHQDGAEVYKTETELWDRDQAVWHIERQDLLDD